MVSFEYLFLPCGDPPPRNYHRIIVRFEDKTVSVDALTDPGEQLSQDRFRDMLLLLGESFNTKGNMRYIDWLRQELAKHDE